VLVPGAVGRVPVDCRLRKPFEDPVAVYEGAETGTVQMKLTPEVSVQSGRLPELTVCQP